ncbi:tryptophan--tRNA ligase [Candidatus Saganbacteria bacterium CG08_land_8_20_14_0_20_45_16]|uniref:Tryptophan--tRNA ligase n=1 Tax=Candidatus Saganbacteria bacterium CG08_land_8_20_14_0_20_45_16 TaxID=2014293 RepID=A0A2H0XV86_UNCSA|nr:MAG: tryptophan--tRNA ligase [Candidatus Saganbacteria bacterium CG08_land_8_20_14_0_20_45_16]
MKKRVLSGIQPTGKLHLGNLIGAIENWVKLQDKYDCYFFIADLHALTTAYDDKDHLKEYINGVAVDLLAAGLDPKKCVIFKQSDLSEHSELHLMLSMVTPVSWLERVPTYKSKIEEMSGKDLGSYGFLGYPVLQAADILMYKADYVPVGQDQLPHIELTREICRRFNNFFGNVFPEPKDLLTEFPTLPGTDGRKMSKSYNNTIALSDPPEEIRKKISIMVTDPARVKKDDPGHPEVCSIYYFYKIFGPDRADQVAQECQAGSRGCVACKKELAEILVKYLTPIHKQREQLSQDPQKVESILQDGAKRAREIAGKTLLHAKQAMGLV